MNYLALIRTGSPEAIVSVFPASTGRIDLPDVGQLSPPQAGWEGDGYRIAGIGPDEIPAGKQVVSRDVNGAELLDGTPAWILEDEPPAPIPDRVTSRQFFLQLDALGLLTAVEAWVDQQSLPIQIAFERSSTFVRDDTMLQQGFTALGFSPQQIDAFFQGASTL